MIKEYFSDGILQIAIILSLLRTDLNSFHFPNNELLSYPEVQDILQGQTVGYLPTNFHNHYNTLNSIGGSLHPKHVDSDFYFSSLFRELRLLSRFQRFSGVSTDIEAFLVSESTFGFPASVQSGTVGTTVNTISENEQNGEHSDSQSQVQQQLLSDISHNNNAESTILCDSDSDIAFHSPFPGCDLTKEDLDLIDVLWRQDVDLGVGKEVFDPGLRRELERERELELLKEAEKRKEADKQQQDKQRQAHLWLTQNFMRDGETGEWVPLAGAESSAVFSPSGPQTSTFLETEDHPVFTLDDALEYVNQHNSENQTYSQFATDTQQFQTSLSGENSSFTVTTFPDPPQQDKQIEETCLVNQSQNYSDYSQFNQSDQDRLEQNWQELMQLLNETTFTNATVNTTSAASSTTSSAMPPVDTQVLLPQTVTSTMNEAHLMQQQQHFNINCPQPMTMLQEQDLCTSTSLNESCILPQQQNTPCGENSILMGLLNDTGMLLQNATMPVAVNNSSSNIMDHNILAGDLGFANGSTNFGSSATSAESLDWESGEMFFHNVTGLTSLSSVGSSTMLDASDFPEFLPDEDLDIAINEGLTSIQMLDEAESDSAVSMGSTSPLQELNDTVENSPFDGLEGATGGSDYDAHTDGYGQQNGRTHSSSGGSEDDGFHYSCSSYGSPASVHTNCSTNSNDTDHSNSGSSSVTTTSHIHHNHTYPTQPGQTPREVKKYAKKDGLHKKGPISRDQRKAEELKIPITFDTIVESPVEEFNEIMAKHKLTEQQIALIRDIRRRGKNKVAAQNCRKRKLDVIYTLEDEMTELQRMRDKLLAERSHIEEQTRRAKDVYGSLYQHIFSSLRDDHGQPYNPSQYSLQQSSDGNVFLVPRNYSTTTTTAISTSPCSSSSSARGRPASSRNFEGKDKNSSQQKKKNKE